MWKTLPCIRIDGEIRERATHEVIEELPVALFINGRHVITAMMSPVMFEDFVTGYLFTEQIIKTADEIESIKIDRNRISVFTKNLFRVTGQKKTILSGCGVVSPQVLFTSRWVVIACLMLYALVRRSLTTWILVSMVVGTEFGHDWPGVGQHARGLSLIFLKLIKTIIAPLLFATLVLRHCRAS